MPSRLRISAPYLVEGERRLARLVDEAVTFEVDRYVEPYLGSGAAAIAVMQRHPDASYLLNANGTSAPGPHDPAVELVNVWLSIHSSVDAVVRAVRRHAEQHSERHFLGVRGWDAAGELATLPPAERAARFIYLCGSARGGGYHVDADGFADAPLGRDAVAFDAANLRALSALLDRIDVKFTIGTAFSVLPEVREDDLVFVTPPGSDLREVRSLIDALTAKGAAVLVAQPQVASGDTGDPLASWRALARVNDETGTDALWANRPFRVRARSQPETR